MQAHASAARRRARHPGSMRRAAAPRFCCSARDRRRCARRRRICSARWRGSSWRCATVPGMCWTRRNQRMRCRPRRAAGRPLCASHAEWRAGPHGAAGARARDQRLQQCGKAAVPGGVVRWRPGARRPAMPGAAKRGVCWQPGSAERAGHAHWPWRQCPQRAHAARISHPMAPGKAGCRLRGRAERLLCARGAAGRWPTSPRTSWRAAGRARRSARCGRWGAAALRPAARRARARPRPWRTWPTGAAMWPCEARARRREAVRVS